MKVIYNFFKITFAPKSCTTLVKGQNTWDDLKTHNTRFSFGSQHRALNSGGQNLGKALLGKLQTPLPASRELRLPHSK